MTKVNVEDVRKFLIDYFSKKLEAQGRTFDKNLPENYDFLLEGLIDSLGFLELTVEVQNQFQAEFDFDEIDPEEMTIVAPFCNFVAQKCNSENTYDN